GHSTLRRSALVLAQPVQSILLFIFFLSIGLLIDLSYVLHHLWLIAHALALRGITEADSLFKESYARELFFLRHWGRRAASAGARAAAAALAAGSEVVRSPDTRRIEPTAGEPDAYHEPFGDVAGPGILPTKRDERR